MKKFWIKPGALLMVLMMTMLVAACDTGGGGGGARFTEGVFIGVAEGLMGDVYTEVVFSRNAILQVRVIQHRETPLHADAVIERIPPQIVRYQTLDVDTVAGSTFTSMAIVAAVEDAVIQANGDPDRLWLTRVRTPESNEVVNLNVEIVIVGAGANGMPAAIAAAQRGVGDVVLLERMPGVGGAGIFVGISHTNNPTISAWHRPLNTPVHQEVVDRVLFDPGFGPAPGAENRALFEYWRAVAIQDYNAHMVSHPNRVFDSLAFSIIEFGNPTAASVANDVATASFMDFINQNGMRWARPTTATMGVWPRTSMPASFPRYTLAEEYFRIFSDYIRRNNLPLEIKLETPATDLIVEGGAVVGVVARHVHGRQYNIRANNVILATGGFGANFDMIFEHAGNLWPELNRTNIRTTNHLGSVGDGIRMAVRDAGARVANMNDITLLPEGHPDTGVLKDFIGLSSSGPWVNTEGRRFTNESWWGIPGVETLTEGRNRISRAMLAQPGGVAWGISDRISSTLVDERNMFAREVDHMIARGEAFMANTLEELAVKIGVPPAVFVQTINNFNERARAGLCDEFIPHRSSATSFFAFATPFADHVLVTEPPFYAALRRPAVHATNGGLVRDPNTWRVIREADGLPIPGLYAIGEILDGAAGVGSIMTTHWGTGKELIRKLYP